MHSCPPAPLPRHHLLPLSLGFLIHPGRAPFNCTLTWLIPPPQPTVLPALRLLVSLPCSLEPSPHLLCLDSFFPPTHPRPRQTWIWLAAFSSPRGGLATLSPNTRHPGPCAALCSAAQHIVLENACSTLPDLGLGACAAPPSKKAPAATAMSCISCARPYEVLAACVSAPQARLQKKAEMGYPEPEAEPAREGGRRGSPSLS